MSDITTARRLAVGIALAAIAATGHAATWVDVSNVRWLVASGQDSHAIAVYAIDPSSGALAPPQRYAVGKNPNWIEIVDLP